jgi:hypothetical protein
VLGPWVNGRRTNAFTSAVVAVLISLSVVLTASVLFPNITGGQITDIIIGCAAASVAAGAWMLARARRRIGGSPVNRSGRENWRMPPLAMLAAPVLSTGRKAGLTALRAYLAIAMILVIVKIIEVAVAH